ncbi:MAG: RdgB/HAM1 family non-canonical purine NTP pyrophosphatase [Pseudomonadota bacterium]|nr:RdgB/HAM1 family non-canonical purine NTP pyrophosphatase [Pseudomonadota bacterium]
MKLVIASSNAGKLVELRALLDASGIELVTQSALGIEDAEETGSTFVENALLKARMAARESGLPALGDDSGLCVDALDGAPGLYSARYAGKHGDVDANIDKLLRELDGVADEQRSAHFHCVVVLLRHADDPRPLIAEASWHGRILTARRGTQGFGYDPIFLDVEQGQTAAEMDAGLKNRISHRGQALVALKRALVGAHGVTMHTC